MEYDLLHVVEPNSIVPMPVGHWVIESSDDKPSLAAKADKLNRNRISPHRNRYCVVERAMA